jgi:alpha-L-rhamnosidase
MTTPAPHAHWIWCAGDEQPRNFYLHVRRTFACKRPVARAEIAITADSRYRLFVNGVSVAAGPARSDRRWQCLDRWDITQYLRDGRNAVAALVHHYGEWTFSYMLGRAAFLAEVTITYADGTTEILGTDESWRVIPSDAWERRLPRMSIQIGFAEVYDARKELTDWTSASYDDSGWHPAVVLGPPGMEPWPQLVPREIPAMTEKPYAPVAVIDSGCVGQPPTGYYVDIHRVIWNALHGVAYVGSYIWSPDDISLEIHAGSQEALKIWLNTELVLSACEKHEFFHDQYAVPVKIRKGWNSVLAKVVQDDMQWHFGFRLQGAGSERCLFAHSMEQVPPAADNVSPWWLLGPIQAESMKAGFDTVFPPERQWQPDMPVTREDGTDLHWVSAGVTKESQITAIVMGRESRFPCTKPLIRNISGLIEEGEPAEFLPASEHGLYAVIDFGKEVTGFPTLRIEGAAGGEVVDIGYSEFLSGPKGEVLSPTDGKLGIVNCSRHAVHYADRYICKPGTQQFRTFDKRAFRYMQVDVRNLKQPLRINQVSLLLSTYPVEYRGHFECADRVLNKIWEIGRWTVQLNMEDAYTDCPWRERGQWWGDARVQALVNYYAFGDLALIRYGLRTMGHSQDAEGWTRGIYPTDWCYAILPTFSLLWIISLHDYMRYSGDLVLPGECLPRAEGILAACERHRAEHGLLRDMPHWNFVDWSGVDSTGESASLNALYHGALCATSAIAKAVKHPELAATYDRIAGEVRSGMRLILWDDAKQCFRESWRDGVLSSEISEQANCWAVTFGVVEGDLAPTVMRAVTQEKKATVLIGTPYFSFYMLEALSRSGHQLQALEYVRERWASMLQWGATTWWENWHTNGSLCHGWSSGPTYFLQSEILGVKPALPGWDEISIAPETAGLPWARGAVPTPHGDIHVEWKSEKEFLLRVEVPRRTCIRLPQQTRKPVSIQRASDGKVCALEQRTDPLGRTVYVIAEPGAYVFATGKPA